MDVQSRKPTALVPIRVEFETETHRIRDCFVWNLNEELIKPESFARTFCADLDIPPNPWAETVANQIRAQLEEHEGVASMDLGLDAMDVYANNEEEIPECRVILSVSLPFSHPSGICWLILSFIYGRLTYRSLRTTSWTISNGTSSHLSLPKPFQSLSAPNWVSQVKPSLWSHTLSTKNSSNTNATPLSGVSSVVTFTPPRQKNMARATVLGTAAV